METTQETMVAVSRSVWDTHRKAIDEAGKKLSLNDFCTVCDKMKDDFAKEHGIPFGFQSNGRYCVYVQDVMKAGGHVNKDDLLSIKWDEIRYDYTEFTVLIKACEAVGNIVEDIEKKNREKAMEWWNGLSQSERDTFIGKHIDINGYCQQLARAGNISSYKVLEIAILEGVSHA